jgi:hypothetical protein
MPVRSAITVTGIPATLAVLRRLLRLSRMVTHAQLPGLYPLLVSSRSSVKPVGLGPMSLKN